MSDLPPVLKDIRCQHCGGRIGVLKTFDDKKKPIVDCGRCVDCLHDTVLPCEDYFIFVNRHCENP